MNQRKEILTEAWQAFQKGNYELASKLYQSLDGQKDSSKFGYSFLSELSKRRASLTTPKTYPHTQKRHEASIAAAHRIRREHPGLAVIIPVHNAYREVSKCLQSVIRRTSKEARIIVIDDASTDKRVTAQLKSLAKESAVEVFHNTRNLGFTKTVNRGIQLAGDRDIILLNSDTIVTEGWVRRLTIAAYSATDIGTVTALSNNAGAFSVPNQGENLIPKEGLVAYSNAICRLSKRFYPETPTGNGFCLYIRRSCLKKVGRFDDQAFPRGYGEENDFCMRAAHEGWRHVVDDSTYIFHVRTASFGPNKTDLIKAGRAVIDQRYPEYTDKARSFTRSESMERVRRHSQETARNIDKVLDQDIQRILFVLPKLGAHGGTPQTNADLMRAISDRALPFLLISDGMNLSFQAMINGNLMELENATLPKAIQPFPHSCDSYDAIVTDWCIRYNIDLVHYRHLAFHSFSLPGTLKAVGIRRVLSLHDFYMVCPTVKLLDDNNRYCEGICTPSEGVCSFDLWKGKELPALKHQSILDWTTMANKVIADFDALITTSQNSRDLICARLPQAKRLPFFVVPHGRDFTRILRPTDYKGNQSRLKILVPGGITIAKGGRIIQEIAEAMGDSVEFHLLGKLAKNVGSIRNMVDHGAYERDEFVGRVISIKPRPQIGAILSIWPETYCHTLTELWASGLPVIGFDLGAVGERIRETNAGWLASEINAESVITLIEKILSSPQDLKNKTMAVQQWQRTVGSKRSTAWMGEKYLKIYKAVSDRQT